MNETQQDPIDLDVMSREERITFLRESTRPDKIALWNAWYKQQGWRLNLTGADLAGAYLEDANFTGADLTDANLSSANLAGAYLDGAWLTDATLTGADLDGADLRSADLEDANLAGAYLTGATINWSSHTLVSELLLRAAEDHVPRRMLAGLVLVSLDWGWDEFLALDLPETDWALSVLASWVKDGDGAPEVLRKRKAALDAGESR